MVVVSTRGAEGENIWIDLGESCFPVEIGESSLRSAETLGRIEGGRPACGLTDRRKVRQVWLGLAGCVFLLLNAGF